MSGYEYFSLGKILTVIYCYKSYKQSLELLQQQKFIMDTGMKLS